MKKLIILLGIVFTFVACKKDSTIRVDNNLSGAIIQNVEWGGVPIASSLLPGETSREVTITDGSNYYGIDFPEEHRLKFYINVNEDLIYLETKEYIKIDSEENIVIELNDSTLVINPLLEEE